MCASQRDAQAVQRVLRGSGAADAQLLAGLTLS
jgi:hypothetical protein